MRLFLDTSTFISVIKEAEGFNCQIMQLVFGIGFYPATILDDETVSVMVYNNPASNGFSRTVWHCKDLKELLKYHSECLVELEEFKQSKVFDTNYSAPETMVYNSKDDEALLNWQQNASKTQSTNK